MLVLGVYVGLWKYVGNGPVWPDAGFEVDQCRATWWSNLLFINNLVKVPYEGSPYGRQMVRKHVIIEYLVLILFKYLVHGLVLVFVDGYAIFYT